VYEDIVKPTPNDNTLAIKNRGFSTLTELLEYAALGSTGFNFYDGRGELSCVLSYRQLRDEAKVLARRLLSLGCERGTRVGIIAETDPVFQRFFFACQYAGLIPVSLPAWIQLGAHKAYVGQTRRLLRSCGAKIIVSPDSHAGFLDELSRDLSLAMAGTAQEFEELPLSKEEPQPLRADEIAYLQYTSGSTRFPRGVEITQQTVLGNLSEIARFGLKLRGGDRFVSWLPYYHDMGLVGFVLVPMMSQLSADYLSPRTFAMRPRLWLKVISENGGTVTSSTSFGYALCEKRLRESDADGYDLSSWRVAAVGAERINPEPLQAFAKALEPSGFRPEAFVACYGMAECVLAVSFAPLGKGLDIDSVDRELMTSKGLARPAGPDTGKTSAFVDCGELLPSFSLMIRDSDDKELGERQCGNIFVNGPSVMSGYFQDEASSSEVLSADGWLNTGDIGYRIGSRLVVTSRSKDVIIINGRNIWPFDLEALLENLPGIRLGGVSAFSHITGDGFEKAVVVVETRCSDASGRSRLVTEVHQTVHEHFGINVHVDLVRHGTLPKTSSGKLSRSRAKKDFLDRTSSPLLEPVVCTDSLLKMA
jgi:fatty-acyl-CoA synthase